MRFIESGESIHGACVRFEHGGKIYCVKGSSVGDITWQVETVIEAGGNLDKLYGQIDPQTVNIGEPQWEEDSLDDTEIEEENEDEQE